MIVHLGKTRYSFFRQSGQAMPLGIALIMFTILIGIVLFNLGQLSTDKSRLANTADAAVYSGLLWQTRALNFQAYTNRAMVANQVTMAQAVSLHAWSLYGRIAAENVDAVLGSIPYVGALSGTIKLLMNSTSALIEPLSNALLSFTNLLNGELSKSQAAMYASAFVATPEIVEGVVHGNDPGFSVNTAFSVTHAGRNLDQWRRFTQQYNVDDNLAMDTRASLINQSRDNFSTTRDWEFFDKWFYIVPFVKFKLHKRGETRLVAGEQQAGGISSRVWEWKAKDTLAFNTRIWRPFRSDKKIELPIGWGQALANQTSGDESVEPGCRGSEADTASGTQTRCQRWFDYNRSSEYMSDNNIASLTGSSSRKKMANHYAGIRAYRDLSDLGAQQKDPRLTLRVEVESALGNLQTASRLNISGVFSTNDYAAGDSLASVASGEVYFQKPLQQGHHDHIEYANTYNPFWDTRLINTPDKTRNQLLLFRGVPLAGASSENNGYEPLEVTDPLDAYQTVGSQQQTNELLVSINAASNALSVALNHTPDEVGSIQPIEEHVASSDSLAAQFSAVSNQADNQTTLVQTGFDQIRDSVSLLYQQAVSQLDQQWRQKEYELMGQIAALNKDLLADLPEEEKTTNEVAIAVLQKELESLSAQFQLIKAETLMAIVNSNSAFYQLDLTTALEIVALEDNIGDKLEELLRVSCGEVDLDLDDSVYAKDEDCESE